MPVRQDRISRKNLTTFDNFKLFAIEKFFVFRQTFINTYYALAHLTLGIEQEYEDEEDGGNSTEQEPGDEAKQRTDDGDTVPSVDDTDHVQGDGEARDQGADPDAQTQGKEREKQEL